jgi:hypothetical protein
MHKTRWSIIIGIIAACLVACSPTPSVTNHGTPQPTAPSYPTDETLQITEWSGAAFYTGTPTFTATLTDGRKIEGTWGAITSLPNTNPGLINCPTTPAGVPYDSLDFRFFQSQRVTREAKIIVFLCAFWNVTSTQWTGVRFYGYSTPSQFQQSWQTLHDLTGVPIPTVPTSSP